MYSKSSLLFVAHFHIMLDLDPPPKRDILLAIFTLYWKEGPTKEIQFNWEST